MFLRLGCEIAYRLRERFRRAGHLGDMMIDIESIHADLGEYLGGQRVWMEEPREAQEPEPEIRAAEPEHGKKSNLLRMTPGWL